MDSTKWADVAHYYSKTHCNQFRDEWLSLVQEGPNIGMFIPILRHRDDMTEAEIKEMFFATVTGAESPHDWKYRIFGTLEYNPNEFHWLISKGFDMFGLIESGQAIRKEVDNGL